MAQNPSNLTKKRPFANEHSTKQHEFVNSNPLGIQPNNKPSASSKRKRHQPPATTSTSAAAATPRANSHDNGYINLPHKMPSQRSVPAFLHKLYNMVGDSSTDPFIRWSADGNSFLVEGHEEFARLILPRFYKHNTFASFVRQLNMYDFHKVPHLQQGVLLACSNNPNAEVWEFSSPNFQRSRPDLLILVTRKRNRDRQDGNADPVNLGALVKEISSIKKHQTNITADLYNLRRDNEIFWQEALAAREKHQKHQQVISKILQFLTAVFSNDHAMLADLTNEETVSGNQQPQPPAVESSKHHRGHKHTHSGSMKGLFKSISQCNVSSSNHRNSSSDSGLGSSDGGVNSSDSGNSSGNGSGSDGDEESKPAASKSLPDASSFQSTPSFNNSQDRKQKGKISASPMDTGTTTEQPTPLSNYHGLGQPAARTAQDITNDIDQLQVNVETLAAQLGIDPTQLAGNYWTDFGSFSENCQGMINSASKTEKRRLFSLADGKKTARHHSLLSQQPLSEYLSVPQQQSHNDMYPRNALLSPYAHQQDIYRRQDAYLPDDYASPTDQLSNSHDFSFQFSHLLKAVDDNLKHPPTTAKETKAGYQQLDANPIYVAPVPSNVPPSPFSPHHSQPAPSSSNFYNTYCNDNALIYTTPDNKNTLQQAQPSFANASSQNHHYFRPNQAQQHSNNTVENTAVQNESHHQSKQVPPHTAPYYVDPASLIPSQSQQQHVYNHPHSLYQPNSLSCPPQQASPSQSTMYAQQQSAGANPGETSFLTDPSTMEKC